MKTQYKFSDQKITNEYDFLYKLPEHVVMLDIQESMDRLKIKSFNSYLKRIQCDRIQRTSISIREISSLLNISLREADKLAVGWTNDIGGQVTYCADIDAYYFKGVCEIIK